MNSLGSVLLTDARFLSVVSWHLPKDRHSYLGKSFL